MGGLRTKRCTCDECGAEYFTYGHYVPARGLLCSKACIASKRLKTYGIRCVQCGEMFVSKSTSRFCSRTCSQTFLKVEQSRLCRSCGEVFRPGKGEVFCSSLCYGQSLKKDRRKPCHCCENVHERKIYGSVYCSKECKLLKQTLRRWVKETLRRWPKQRQLVVRKSSAFLWWKRCVREARKKAPRKRTKTWKDKCRSAVGTNRHRVSVKPFRRVSPTKGCKTWEQAVRTALRVCTARFRRDPWRIKCENTASHLRQRMRRLLQRRNSTT